MMIEIELVEKLISDFRQLPLEGDAGCDKLTDNEWRMVARTALTTTGTRMSAAEAIGQMRAELAYYDYLLPGDWLPEPPMVKRWFRWRPAFAVTQEMVVWAGEIARARSLMDLKQAEELAAAPPQESSGSVDAGTLAAS